MKPSAKKKYLLLDSCIVEYWLDDDISSVIAQTLSVWGNNSLPAVSDISYAELIRGAHKSKINKVKLRLDNFTNFEVSKRILSGSGILENIYRAESKEQNGASTEDMIIATTSFIFGTPIVTANVTDFPYPFFITEQSSNLFYKKKGREKLITVALLRPNTEIIKYWYDQTK